MILLFYYCEPFLDEVKNECERLSDCCYQRTEKWVVPIYLNSLVVDVTGFVLVGVNNENSASTDYKASHVHSRQLYALFNLLWIHFLIVD